MADAAITVEVGRASDRDRALRDAAHEALAGARAGTPINAIGRRVEAVARRRGFTVLGELSGHGVGRAIHEDPVVPNVEVPGMDRPLEAGTVITIEPILAAGATRTRLGDDGWVLATDDGSRAAHAEHTIVVADGFPLVITA